MKLKKTINTLVCIKYRMCDRDLGEVKQGPANKRGSVVNGNLLQVDF